MVLSVLICTIESRKVKFDKLYQHLKKQNKYSDVEILFECDNKEISVGKKRQNLLEKAKGKFVCFIDDDDWVPSDYIDTIRHIVFNNDDIDCIGFQIQCQGTKFETANCSNKYSNWEDLKDGFGYVRTIYHKSPVRRELALKAGFPDKRFAEDHDYSMRLKPHLKNEYYLDRVMYFYRYEFENHNTKYGIR